MQLFLPFRYRANDERLDENDLAIDHEVSSKKFTFHQDSSIHIIITELGKGLAGKPIGFFFYFSQEVKD